MQGNKVASAVASRDYPQGSQSELFLHLQRMLRLPSGAQYLLRIQCLKYFYQCNQLRMPRLVLALCVLGPLPFHHVRTKNIDLTRLRSKLLSNLQLADVDRVPLRVGLCRFLVQIRHH